MDLSDDGRLDQMAFNAALEAELPALRRFARRLARTPADSDDLVQETVMRALRSSHQFQPGTTLSYWLFAILRNAFNAEYRRRRREVAGLDPSIFERPAIAAPQEWAVRCDELRKALARVPAKSRQTLLLVASGVSYDETAKRCSCGIGTVKSRVSHARRALERELGQIDG